MRGSIRSRERPVKRTARKRWRHVAVLAQTLALCACATILDIKDLPLNEVDGGVPASDAIAADVTPEGGCNTTATRFCERLCPAADFCDDFEGTVLAEGWVPPVGLTNPLRSTPSSNVSLVRDDAGPQSQVVLAEARSTTTDADTALIITTLERATRGRKLRGVRVAVEARATELYFNRPDGSAFIGEMSFLAFGSQGTNEGIGVAFFDDGSNELRIGLQQRRIGGGGVKYDLLPSVLSGPRNAFLSNTFAIDLYVGTPTLLRELKIGCTPTADAGEDAGGENDARAVLLLSKTSVKCTSLKGELASGDWFDSTALFLGASVSDFGTVSIRLDNLAVYLFE